MCSEAFKELWHLASLLYFHLLILEKLRWPRFLENNNIFHFQNDQLQSSSLYSTLRPILFDSSASTARSGVRMDREKRQLCCNILLFALKDKKWKYLSGLHSTVHSTVIRSFVFFKESEGLMLTFPWLRPSVIHNYGNYLPLLTLDLPTSSPKSFCQVSMMF